MTTEIRRRIWQSKATITIQSYWSGYFIRKQQNYKVRVIRSKLRYSQRDRKLYNTIKYELSSWIKCIRARCRFSVYEVYSVLRRLGKFSFILIRFLLKTHMLVLCFLYYFKIFLKCTRNASMSTFSQATWKKIHLLISLWLKVLDIVSTRKLCWRV